MLYNVIGEYEVDKLTGLISDQLIRLTGLTPSVQYTEPLRIVVFEDYATGNVYRFLTNNLTIDTLIVAELYRERWSVELFFRWIKQYLHIKKLYSTTENSFIFSCRLLFVIICYSS